jgi:FkbH-like protein
MKTDNQIKCLIWDLDNTIWTGTFAEYDSCRLKTGIISVLKLLDSRGILMSIASANDAQPAIARLKKLNIFHYFIHPQINWENKVKNIRAIARRLDISMSTIGFIDDEPFELAQVQMLLPDVRTYAAEDYCTLSELPEFNPRFVTEESSRRREMYIQTQLRTDAEKEYRCTRSDFLQWTQTRLSFRTARDTDFERIMELMNRTSQLNATGTIFAPETVKGFLQDSSHGVYIAELRDRFVDYGKIGVAICRRHRNKWRLISFLVSCRVLSRGISGVILNMVRHEAYIDGVGVFEACYKKQHRNRKMLMLYTLNGLAYQGDEDENVSIYCGDSRENPAIPRWLTIIKDNTHEAMSHTVD